MPMDDNNAVYAGKLAIRRIGMPGLAQLDETGAGLERTPDQVQNRGWPRRASEISYSGGNHNRRRDRQIGLGEIEHRQLTHRLPSAPLCPFAPTVRARRPKR